MSIMNRMSGSTLSRGSTSSRSAARLTLGQIDSALAYYWDHREELDRGIQRRLERVGELRGEFKRFSRQRT
jgi:hypothetical protein